jgi:hypothetical protein
MSAIFDLGTTVLGLDPLTANIKLIFAAVRKLSARDRRRLLNGLDARMRGDAKRHERERIAAARLLVACLPDSMSVIRRWVRATSGRWDYEIHFSLFCFLGDSQLLGLDRMLTEALLRSVSDYLLTARKNTAKAVWMAGDLLGDHWEGPKALTILVDASCNARYVAGRAAAIHGLEHRLRRSGQRDRSLILNVLESIARRDRSPRLRRRAARMLAKSARV